MLRCWSEQWSNIREKSNFRLSFSKDSMGYIVVISPNTVRPDKKIHHKCYNRHDTHYFSKHSINSLVSSFIALSTGWSIKIPHCQWKIFTLTISLAKYLLLIIIPKLLMYLILDWNKWRPIRFICIDDHFHNVKIPRKINFSRIGCF